MNHIGPILLTHTDTSQPCFGHRPEALADRCQELGLENCAATIRGLLEEREALRKFVKASSSHEQREAWLDGVELLMKRGVIT